MHPSPFVAAAADEWALPVWVCVDLEENWITMQIYSLF